jgi:hypothetical protein
MNAGRPTLTSATRSYTLERVLQITGVSRQTLVAYCEHGILPLTPEDMERAIFDDELVWAIRRTTFLQQRHGINLAGLRLINRLLTEVEQLRRELRFVRDAG